MTATEFQTGRISARPFLADDWPLIHALQTDAQAGYWLRGPNIEASKGRSRTIAARLASQWEEGWGPFHLSVDGTAAGYAGLRRSRLEDRAEIEALWGLLPVHWRQGIASGAMEVVLRDHVPAACTRVACWTLPENAASRGLMERLGFRYDRTAQHVGLLHVVYQRPV